MSSVPTSAVPLREAHAHIAAHGRAMSMERFESRTGVDDFLQHVAASAARARAADEGDGTRRSRSGLAKDASSWLLGGGARVEGWSDPRWPTLKELDAATGPRPACIWSFDYHALLINSAAMRALDIAEDAADPPNGRIVRDDQGRLTGLMLESAAKLVWSRIPEPGPELRRAQVEAALADLAGHGFVEIHDLLSPPWLGPLLGELDRAGRLPARILLYPPLADLDATLATQKRWGSDQVTLAGAKLFADGTLNSRTAWMLHPYADPLPGLPCGQQMLTREDLTSAMQRVWSMSLGLAVHAIGDAAVREVLNAFQCSMSSLHPSVPSSLPALRIEHAELIDEADVPRFARLGVVASVQPCHLLTDIEVLRRQLPHQLSRVLPLRELIDSGCLPGELLWFGSDTPIVRPHPRDSVQAAVHRRRADMPPSDAIAPEQSIHWTKAKRAFLSTA